MIFRQARPGDIPAIVDLAVESVLRDPIPVKIDRDGMADMAKQCMAPNHFVWVGEKDGKVVSCVGALTQPGFWFYGLQASVLLFYTREPGCGAPLLREFARWVKSRPAIKMAVFSLERGADPRIGKLLKRLGFNMENPQFTYVRGLK